MTFEPSPHKPRLRWRRVNGGLGMEIAKLAPADGLLTTADMPREAKPSPALSPHTRRLLQDPVVPMLLRMAWPNILIMLAQASTGLIETFWVARLGTDALAGMALVFPVVMLMQTISAGAMGGGISAAIARALGRGQRDDADALVLHAVVINIVLGLVFSAIMLVFAGNVLLWVMNGLASAIRGTGNMLVPAIVICVGVVFLVPLSPVLIFGWGPIPALGVAGGGTAIVAFYAAGTAVLGWYVLSGRNLARLRRARLRWPLFRDILRVGAVASLQSVQTNLTIALATALVAGAAGVDAVAGFGTGVRLEYLLIPLVFGLGAPLVALVGTNIGAGQQQRALHIALTGGALAFALTETLGLVAAIWPAQWLSLFSAEPSMIETGSAYLRIVGPAYGFFGLGLSLYFASQGAGRLFWPLFFGFLRVFISIVGGWLVLRWTGSLEWMFAALALGLVVFGTSVALAIRSGAWFRGQ